MIALGSLVAVFGVRLFFLLLPVWAFLAGFALGAQAVALLPGEGFLATGLGWLAGAGLGLLFAILAGLWFWAAIVILAGTVGWAVVTGALHGLGIEPGLVTLVAGVAGGGLLVVLAIVLDAPIALVAILTAFGGAGYAVAGGLLVLGRIGLDDLADGAIASFRELPAAVIAWLALAVLAVAWQLVDARGRAVAPLARPGRPVAGL
jgi:hypothetical protein